MAFSIQSAIERIREYRKEQGITKFRLAVIAGIPEGCLRGLDREDWNPTLETLKAIDSVIPQNFSAHKSKHRMLPEPPASP